MSYISLSLAWIWDLELYIHLHLYLSEDLALNSHMISNNKDQGGVGLI